MRVVCYYTGVFSGGGIRGESPPQKIRNSGQGRAGGIPPQIKNPWKFGRKLPPNP